MNLVIHQYGTTSLAAAALCPHCDPQTGECPHFQLEGGGVTCCQCGGFTDWHPIDWLYNLARAIAVAGALCASFEAGLHQGHGDGWGAAKDFWEPLCGRPFHL